MTFQREDRYIVIKRSDLKKVPVNYRSHLVDPMFSLLGHLPHRECLVIESDWPEYEPAWAMIEARMSGAPSAQLGATVLPPDDQDEINRLHAEFLAIDEPNNEQVMAFQDASYALGLKRGHGDLRAELDQCGAMADMLLDREWAEHSGTGDISRKLESAITELHNELSESRQREDALQQRLNEADQALDEARQAVRKNHEWHQLHDDFGGYDGSDIEQTNLAVLGQTEAELSCCIQTPEEKALLAHGEYTPEELYGAGGKPSCPKCHKGTATGVQLTKGSPEVGS